MCAQVKTCRICYGTETDPDDEPSSWIRPCKCKGSLGDVHQDCLVLWLTSTIGREMQCGICLQPFQLLTGSFRPMSQCWIIVKQEYQVARRYFWLPWGITVLIVARMIRNITLPVILLLGSQSIQSKWNMQLTCRPSVALLNNMMLTLNFWLCLPELYKDSRYLRQIWTRLHTILISNYHQN